MARTVAQIDAELEQLRALRASGEQSVRHRDGTAITNQPLSEIEKSIARLEAERDRLANGGRRRRIVRFYQRGTGL